MTKGKFEFFEGQSLLSLRWEQGESAYVGRNGVVSITVSMENGQMAAVPWAVVLREDGSAFKHNLALVSGVRLNLKKNG